MATNAVKLTDGTAGRRGMLVALAAFAALVLSPVAALISHFHVSSEVAAQIVALIVSGSWAIDFLFPWIIPFVGTVQAIIIAAGTGVAIGW